MGTWIGLRRMRVAGLGVVLAVSGAAATAMAGGPDIAIGEPGFEKNRIEMVETILDEVRLTSSWIGKATLDPRIVGLMTRIPRHKFVPRKLESFAYLNRPLPVGFGQTVSQPYLVALMTDLAEIDKGDDVLLLGIGGGYHAAIIADLAGSVRVVDMQAEALAAAMNRLVALGYRNVEVANHDPYFGWRGEPHRFDAIVVRQATNFIPEALIRQLKPGGRIVAPVGMSDERQDLVVARKTREGKLVERVVMPVRFTRLPGGPRI